MQAPKHQHLESGNYSSFIDKLNCSLGNKDAPVLWHKPTFLLTRTKNVFPRVTIKHAHQSTYTNIVLKTHRRHLKFNRRAPFLISKAILAKMVRSSPTKSSPGHAPGILSSPPRWNLSPAAVYSTYTRAHAAHALDANKWTRKITRKRETERGQLRRLEKERKSERRENERELRAREERERERENREREGGERRLSCRFAR